MKLLRMVLKILIYEFFFFWSVSQCLKLGFPNSERWVEICFVRWKDWPRTRLNVLLMTNLLTLSKALNVTLARCNLKCSPLVGMLVQGFTKVLKMITIGMNLICVWKIVWNGKDLCINYAHCENGQVAKFRVEEGCSTPLECLCSTSTA